jgi:hypothetical protein
MTKGLVIGNSHVAMIAKSWRESPERFTAIDHLDFFAQPGDGPQGVEFNGSVMRATDPELLQFLSDSGAKPEHDLSGFDFIVIVACGFSFFPVAQALLKHHVWGWPSSSRVLQKKPTLARGQIISDACLQAALHDIFSKSLAAKLATNISGITSVPIYIVAQPLPSELLSTRTDKGHGFRRIDKIGDNCHASNAFKFALNSVLSPIKSATVIFQPEETTLRDIYTKLDFTTGASLLQDLDKNQSKQDILHANHHLGTLFLSQINRQISQQ